MLSSHLPGRLAIVSGACGLALLASGCSSVSSLVSGDKIDYRSSGAKTVSLEVPPDLSQLSGQGRYAYANTGPVSASALSQQAQGTDAAGAQSSAVAPTALGGVTLERDGQTRWLSVAMPPEQVWPLVRDFWVENGFELPVERAQSGEMETNWNENRAKLKEDGLRNLVGRVIDNLYDTGERDQFVTRLERSPKGTDIYVAHKGMIEVYTDTRKEQTTWRARPSDPMLEAKMLSRLMVKLGASKEAAQEATATAPSAAATTTPSARVLSDGVTVTVNGGFDQAWRRVGLALDRGGFTVEDRDRSSGVYEVRLAAVSDPSDKPGLFSRMFNWFGSKPSTDTLTRYRLKVATQGGSSTVTVLDSSNNPAATQGGRDVAKQLAINLD